VHARGRDAPEATGTQEPGAARCSQAALVPGVTTSLMRLPSQWAEPERTPAGPYCGEPRHSSGGLRRPLTIALATSRFTQAWASKRSGCLHLPGMSGKRWTTHVQALPAFARVLSATDRVTLKQLDCLGVTLASTRREGTGAKALFHLFFLEIRQSLLLRLIAMLYC